MKIANYLLVILLIVTQVLFSQTADQPDGCAPLTVKFTPPSGLNNYFWDFKDGATSTLASPTNTFLNTGVYQVELKSGINGSLIGTVEVKVFSKPDPSITVDIAKGCAPLSVQFSDATNLSPSVSVSSYSWVFEDGGTATGSSVGHTFTTPGNFWVSLELNTTLPSCNVTKQFNNFINVSPPPNTSFQTTPDPPSSCTAPLSVSFTNTSSANSPLSYQWDLGNGTTSTNTNPPDANYTQDGIYNVSLTATDTNNCSSSASRIVSVGSPVADIQFPDTVCLGERNTIINLSSSGSINWDFGGGTFLGFASPDNPIIAYRTPGDKTIRINIQVGNCTADTTINTYVQNPSADFVSTPQFGCQLPFTISYDALESGLNYQWDFNGQDTSIEKSTTYTFPFINGENPYIIHQYDFLETTLIVSTNFGCKDTVTRSDTLFRPTALMMPNKVNGCLPLDVTFSDSSQFLTEDSLVKWEWFFGDGNSLVSNQDTSVTHTYNQAGVYQSYLIVTTLSGCTDTSFLTPIEVGDQIALSLSASPTTVCPGDTITLTGAVLNGNADSVKTWRFSNGNGTIPNPNDSSSVQFVYDINQLGTTISLSGEYNGCPSTVNLNPPIICQQPRAQIDYRSYCDSALVVQFYDSSVNVDRVHWQFGDGDTSILSNPRHEYSATGDYQVILKVERLNSPCPIDYDTVLIRVREIKADFTFDTIACKGVPHTLDASASNNVYENCYDGYTWSFSDSTMRPITTANSIDSVRFNLTGKQEITLVVKDFSGCRDTLTQSIDIYGVVADFTISDSSICAPATVNVTNQSTADTTLIQWDWNIGNDTTYSTKDIVHNYNNFKPIDTLQLIATDTLGCKDTLMKFINMYIPTSNYAIVDNTLCLGDSTFFSATDYTSQGSNLNFLWQFGNGDTSTQQNPHYLYPNAGNYTAQLLIEENSSGCQNSYNMNVQVENNPVAGFFTSNDSSNFICPNENVIFTDTTISNRTLTYSWNFGNGRSSNFPNPGTVYIDNRDYVVTMKVTMDPPFGCEDSISRILRVKGPSGNFSTDLGMDTICRLDSVLFTIKDTADVEQYVWDFGDGNTLSNVSPVSHQYTFVPPSGQTFAKLILSNSDGSCPSTIDTVIHIYQVIADFQRNDEIDTAFCFAPLQLTNVSNRATEWTWNFGDGNSMQMGNQFVYEYDSAGVYDITLTARNNNLNCNDSTTKRVILYPNPEFTISTDTICEGETTQILSSVNDTSWTYNWTAEPSLNINLADSAILDVSPILTTKFQLDVIDTNGCIASDTDTLAVINDLRLEDFDTIIVVGDRIDLPIYADAGLYNYTWTPTDGLSCLDCFPPSVQPLEKVEYNLLIADKLNCFNYNVDFIVDVHPETFIKMPTTFTPNGDGVNDIIYVEGWGIRELLSYQIFNRWGELVFETNNLKEGWDGTYKGKIQNNDLYVFKVRVSTWRDEEKALEGYINLVR